MPRRSTTLITAAPQKATRKAAEAPVSHNVELAAPAVAVPATPHRVGVLHDPTRRFRTALAVGNDVFLVIGVAFCIPIVILALGIPITLVVRLLFWLAGLV